MKIAVLAAEGALQVGYVGADGHSVRPVKLSADQASSGILALLQPGAGEVESGAARPLDTFALRAPVPHPIRNIFCVGKNYAEHARELVKHGAQEDLPKYPIFFTKVPETVIGPGDAILIDPSVSAKIDYEGELAVIIGKAGRNIPAASAMDHVWGYTIVNDVTARDLQRRHQQWLIGKSQDTFCPMGPWAVTRDEIDLADTAIRTYVNGELRQDGNTRDLIFGVPELIAALSNGITLKPGDIIATGTPAGVGLGFDPPRYLKDGDVVRVEVEGIGVLENPVRLR
jgi:2-keto-4-pentenoate hydratase/2-oxohepta-3-ene-1,7-dioic acid hydratase in catechol pathway